MAVLSVLFSTMMRLVSTSFGSIIIRVSDLLYLILIKQNLSRDALLLMIGTMISSISGFVFWKIAATLYLPEIVGMASVAFSSISFIVGVSQLGLTMGCVYFLPRLSTQEKATLITFSHLISAIIGVMVATVFLLGRHIWAPNMILGQSAALFIVVFFGMTIVFNLLNIHIATLQSERDMLVLVIRSVFVSVMQPILLLLIPTSLSLISILIAMFIPNILTVIIIFWFIRSRRNIIVPRFKFSISFLKPILKYSLSNQLFNILWSLPSFIFPLITLQFAGAESSGSLAIAWFLNNALLIIPNSVSVALLVDGVHNQRDMIVSSRRALLINISLLTPIIFVIVVFASTILSLFGKHYTEATSLLRLLALANIPGSVISVYLTQKQIEMKLLQLNILTVALVSTTIILCTILILSIGITGIGWGWLMAQILFCLLFIGSSYKAYKYQKFV